MRRRPATSLKQLSELWTAASSNRTGQVVASLHPALHATSIVSSSASIPSSQHDVGCRSAHSERLSYPKFKSPILTHEHCVLSRPALRHQQHEYQHGFATVPKRSKRVQAAIQRRTKNVPQHAESIADTQPEAALADSEQSEQSVVTADSAASQAEVANVVGHPGQAYAASVFWRSVR